MPTREGLKTFDNDHNGHVAIDSDRTVAGKYFTIRGQGGNIFLAFDHGPMRKKGIFRKPGGMT